MLNPLEMLESRNWDRLYLEWLRGQPEESCMDSRAHRELFPSILNLLMIYFGRSEKSEDLSTIIQMANLISRDLAKESNFTKQSLIWKAQSHRMRSDARRLCDKLDASSFISIRELQRKYHRITRSELHQLLLFVEAQGIVIQNDTGFALASEEAPLRLAQ